MAHNRSRLVRLLHGVPYRAFVTTPSGKRVPLFTENELQVVKAFIETRFSIVEAAHKLGKTKWSVDSCLYGSHDGEHHLGILKKLEMYHEQQSVCV